MRSTTSVVLGVFSAMLIFSFAVLPLLSFTQVGTLLLLGLPAHFLVRSFHAAALFVPVYLAVAAVFARRSVSGSRVLALNLSVLPFLTSSLALRLALDPRAIFSPATSTVIQVLGRVRGAWAFGLLTVLLIALIAAVVRLWHSLVGDDTPGWQSARSSDRAAIPVLELPPPAAAYAGPFTPTARRREEAQQRSEEQTQKNGEQAAEEQADDLPLEADDSVFFYGSGTDGDGASASSRTTALSPLEIAWPNGRSRVRFEKSNEALEDLEALRDEAEFGDAANPVTDADTDVDTEFAVRFSNGSFFSLGHDADGDSGDDSDGDEILAEDVEVQLGFGSGVDVDLLVDADHGDHGGYTHAGGGDTDGDETVDEYDEADESDEESCDADESDDFIPPAVVPARRTAGRGRRSRRYDVPIDGILDVYPDTKYWEVDAQTKAAAETLRITLEEFGIEAEVTGIRRGPVITMFEILPARGVKLTKIVNLADNIALRLAAQTVRIVAPIPGKHAVGIEVPNKSRAIVSFADLVQEKEFTQAHHTIPLAIGKDIPGDAQIMDLTKTPHLLIAGATGSGKSVCVNSIICSILYRRSPQEVKMILIDPKIVELKFYNDIPHLLTPVITEPKRAFQALQWCLYEMERRYQLLDSLQVRDLSSYNRRIEQRKLATEKLPFIVIVVDEFADLMATSGKELEQTLARLAAMSRAVGIHLVLATQRPSTDVITGLIKANIPSRIAFMVSSKVDSRIILDGQGAEKLLGRGDMLVTSAWDPAPTRIQGAFLSDEEIERVVTHVRSLGEPDYIDDEIFIDEDDDDSVREELEDPLMEKAIQIVQTSRKASASYLQRRLKIGYNRAARMVEEMERLGIVGPQNGSKPRDILMNV